jgi:hypothetical protein
MQSHILSDIERESLYKGNNTGQEERCPMHAKRYEITIKDHNEGFTLTIPW